MNRNLSTILLLFVAGHALAQFHTLEFQKVRPSVQVVKQYESKSKSLEIELRAILPEEIHCPNEPAFLLASLPLDEIFLTSAYGYRSDPISGERKFHRGIDLKTNRSKVYAMLHGQILRVGSDPLLGNFVKVRHGSYESIYGHLSQIWVSESEEVLPGTVMGISGSSGKSTGDHLHLTVKKGKEYVNPVLFIQMIAKLRTKEHVITYLSNQ
ncbi:MAG: M23 family metallopeptidase [Algoriphagus sp.]|jgi:murein DD-endopeptidase MepM/ murein hydrolase activator NlpD|nr:M23 family metallopeptidase [Algoriphagus sp.]